MSEAMGGVRLDRGAVHVAVDMQRVIAEPGPWFVPWMPKVLPHLVEPLRMLVPPARLCDKAVYSAFGNPGLARWLAAQGVRTLVVTGGETDVCVLATVIAAIDHGFHVVLPTDALCSGNDASHDALLTLYRQRFAHQIATVSTEEILSRWE
jgi:nicotinamidase-related amidase